VKADDNTTDLEISNLQAMVAGDRIMMMGTSIVDGDEVRFLYDGTITITQNSFEASFRIYTTTVISSVGTGGQNPIDATASGTIDEGKSITGTLVGSGVGNGTFSLNYGVSNNQAADILRIENGPDNINWSAKIGGGAGEQEFIIDNAGSITHDLSSGGGVFSTCNMDGTITPISGTSLYSVIITLTTCNAGGGLPNGDYTGLAASRTQDLLDPDDTLVFAVTNGTYSPNGDFK
jgi:hypothetical protein